MTKIYNCSVINKYLIVGEHLLTTFLVILKSLKGTINNLGTSTSFVELTSQFNNKNHS
jgi:hypothetical protein